MLPCVKDMCVVCWGRDRLSVREGELWMDPRLDRHTPGVVEYEIHISFTSLLISA